MTTRRRKRLEAKYRGQWELRWGRVIHLGGSRRFNQRSVRIFRDCGGPIFARSAFKSFIHKGGRP